MHIHISTEFVTPICIINKSAMEAKEIGYVFILLDMLIFYLNRVCFYFIRHVNILFKHSIFIFNTFSWRENNAIFMACFLDEQDL